MLSLLLAVTALPTAATLSPDFTLCVDSRSMVAHNTSLHAELVVLRDPQRGHEAAFVIQPQRSLELRFPAGALEGLELSVALRTPQGVRRAGHWSLDVLRAQGACAGFDLDSATFHAWSFAGRGTTGVPFVGPALPSSSAPLCAPPTAPHVPAITPHDIKRGDAPPRLENKPLPPV
jgi:hypothetical protein